MNFDCINVGNLNKVNNNIKYQTDRNLECVKVVMFY